MDNMNPTKHIPCGFSLLFYAIYSKYPVPGGHYFRVWKIFMTDLLIKDVFADRPKIFFNFAVHF
jgi:hypothetical protein